MPGQGPDAAFGPGAAAVDEAREAKFDGHVTRRDKHGKREAVPVPVPQDPLVAEREADADDVP